MLNKMTRPYFFYNYLYNGGLNHVGFKFFFNKGPLFAEVMYEEYHSDYFSMSRNDKTSVLLNSLHYLSDDCIQLSLSINKFNHILSSTYFSIDSFVSSYTSLSPYYDFNVFNNFIYNLKFPYHVFFMLNSQK